VPEPAGDALAGEELAMDRARLLLERYGVVCRDVLAGEAPGLGWGGVFRALRRMELSGEVTSGEFFAGLGGPQFASARAVRLLAGGLGGDEPWWCSGRDPVALWNSGPADGGLALPRRAAGAYVAFAGARPTIAVEARGGRIHIALSPDDPGLPAALSPLVHLLTRRTLPETRLSIAAINAAPAEDSPYLAVLRQLFEVVRERRGLTLFRSRGEG